MAFYFQINHDVKLIAIFSPKCACQTIGTWFMTSLDLESKGEFRHLADHRVDYRRIPDFTDYLKVFFVRDPFRRLVSFYAKWVVRENQQWCFADRDQRFSLRDRSFRRFIYVLDHLHQHQLQLQHHLLAQLLNVPLDCLDRVIQVEALESELEALNRELGISTRVAKLNRQKYAMNQKAPAADMSPGQLDRNGIPAAEWFYDDEIIAITSKIYQQDINFYRRYSDTLLAPLG